MSNGIAWLHLSDLHCGSAAFERTWGAVRSDMWTDLKEQITKINGQLDLVLFTGDLTQSGASDQFRRLDEFLAELWQLLKLLGCTPKLFAVPGNHDLVRPTADDRKDAPYNNLTKNWHEDYVQHAFWDPSKVSPSRDLVLKAFGNYKEWWENVGCMTLDVACGILPGDWSVTFKKDDIRLGLLGLNSAFLQLCDEIRENDGVLDIRLQQANAACVGSDLAKWVDEHHACLLLTHHPATWLYKSGQKFVEEICNGPSRFALHLFGHMHEQRVAEISVQWGRPRVTIQGHSLLSAEPWNDGTSRRPRLAAGYSLGRLVRRGSGVAYSLTPRIRAQSGGQHRMMRDYSFEYASEADEQTRWKPIVSRSLSGDPHPNPIVDIFSKHYKNVAALAGPLSYEAAHKFLKSWLKESTAKLGPVSVKNIAFDMQHTFICIDTLINQSNATEGIVWKTIFLDHESQDLRAQLEKDLEIRAQSAQDNESRLSILIANQSRELAAKGIDLDARAYRQIPPLHGFLFNECVLVAGVCSAIDGQVRTTPYMVFLRDQGDVDIDLRTSKDMIGIFSKWFDAQWSCSRRIVKTGAGGVNPGVLLPL